MALVVTPGSLRAFADFYRRLAQFLSAGVTLIQALEQIQRNPPKRAWRAPVERVIEELKSGETLAEALRREPRWVPLFDVALIQAGEQSGRLDTTLRLVAQFYEERAQNAHQMLADLAYPALLLHLAAFILPFPQFFLTGNLVVYLSQVFGVLGPVYLVIIVGLLASQGRQGESWRVVVERLARWVPLLGGARRNRAIARLAAALEALLGAGVHVVTAWELAAAASGSPALARSVAGWRPRLEAGDTPGELLLAGKTFPEFFATHYRTGEISGSLDDSLTHLRQFYQEEASRQFRALARWVPRLIYFLVLVLVAWQVVQLGLRVFGQYQNAAGF